ncbi:MAG TPA: oxygen-independent coproporphyrinogen III oxidase [Vicinamibacterales bacterium]|nr:oxygen-independent coproporphyrinogen III oxidase [Vicinamibacterales bacterium]
MTTSLTDLFARYDVPVPRYTSYPTVPEWHAQPTTGEWIASLDAAIAAPDATLSLYVHLPFCESLCTFCGCNTVITKDHSRSQPYVELVLRELDAYLARVPALAKRSVSEIHLGGGTPTFLPPAELAQLIDGLFSRLTPAADVHGSVEADPRVTRREHLDTLRTRGFSRLSLGIQDFNDETQQLVNRIQSPALVAELVRHARESGYESINFDLIYGLPGQTPESMRATAREVLALAPDRLAVYSFARVPWIKPQQRKFRDDQIPAGAEKRALYETVREPLLASGYLELGLDHFARPDDALARAAASGAMHRNFQGYTERRTTVLFGLGVSAISETPDCYHQNEKIITVYDRRVQKDEIPTLRGHKLSGDDRSRRDKILALMTGFRVALDEAEREDARAYLAPMFDDGLVEIRDEELRIPTRGRPFLRNAAVVFDAHFRSREPGGPRYSTAV